MFMTAIAADWALHFWPAINRLLSGLNPYAVDPNLFCPPWALIPLLPFWWDELGLWYMIATTLVVTTAVWHLSEHDRATTIAFMLNPLTLGMIWQRNLDWMLVVGLALPAPYSTFFLLAKPHLGAPAALWQARKNQIHLVIAVVATMVAAVYMFRGDIKHPLGGTWNGAQFWPWTIPLGLLVAWLYPTPAGLVAAACFCVPYFARWSVALATPPLLKYKWRMVSFTVCTWIFFGTALVWPLII